MGYVLQLQITAYKISNFLPTKKIIYPKIISFFKTNISDSVHHITCNKQQANPTIE